VARGRRVSLRKSISVVLSAAACVAAVALAADPPVNDDPEPSPLELQIDESSSELARLRQEIAAQRQKLVTVDDREAEVQRSYDDIQREIELTRKLLGEMEQRERLLGQRSVELKTDLRFSRRTYDWRRDALARNLRAMYLRGQHNELEAILTAESFSDLVTRMKWEAMLARMGASLVEQTRSEGVHIHREQKVLDAALAEIWQTRQDADLQQGAMAELMAEQMAVLRALDAERSGIRDRLLELGMNEQKLQYVLEDLEQQRSEREARSDVVASTLAELAGQLEWPVRGRVVRSFGRSVHPRFKTVTLNNGLNIAAQTGSPVAAVARGTVEFSDHLPGFGQCVILDHGAGYYTLYAHLAGVFVVSGDDIAGGQVIAEVGRPQGETEPQLYFEVRRGRTPLDPADWLKSR